MQGIQNRFLGFIICVSIGLISSLSSCRLNEVDLNDIENPSLQPTYNFALGEVSYRLGELIGELEDSIITVNAPENSSQTIELIYNDTVIFNDPFELFTMDEAVDAQIIVNPTVNFIAPIDTVIDIDQLNLDPIQIDFVTNKKLRRIDFKSGTLNLRVGSPFSIDFSLSFPDLTLDGTPLTVIDSTNSNRSIDISGYSLAINEIEGSDTSFITSQLSGQINLGVGEQITTSSTLVLIETNFSNSEYEEIVVQVGSEEIDFEGEPLNLSFFDEFDPDVISFANPRIEFEVLNYFGVFFGIDFNGFLTATGQDGQQHVLQYDSDDGLELVNPNISNRSSGRGELTRIRITSDNSNLDTLFNSSPTQLTYGMTAFTNPDQDTVQDGRYSIIGADDSLQVAFAFTLPLSVVIDSLTRNFQFDLSDAPDIEQVDSIALRLKIQNDFPLYASINIGILDRDSIVTYQYPGDTGLLVLQPKPSNVNSAPEIIQRIWFDEEGKEALLDSNSDKFFINLVANTFETDSLRDEFVNFSANSSLTIEVAAEIYVNFEL